MVSKESSGFIKRGGCRWQGQDSLLRSVAVRGALGALVQF